MRIHILGQDEQTLSYIFDIVSYWNEKPDILIDDSLKDININDLYTFGESQVEKKRLNFEKVGIDWEHYYNILHPNAIISNTAKIGSGVIIQSGVVIEPYVNIGNGVTIYSNTVVGSYSVIDDFCLIERGVNIGFRCNVEEMATIKMGTCIRDGVTVGKYSVVGENSVVGRDIPGWKYAMGNPIILKRNLPVL